MDIKLTRENVRKMLEIIKRATAEIMPMAIPFYEFHRNEVILEPVFYDIVQRLRKKCRKYPEAYRYARILWRRKGIDFEKTYTATQSPFYYYITFEDE